MRIFFFFSSHSSPSTIASPLPLPFSNFAPRVMDVIAGRAREPTLADPYHTSIPAANACANLTSLEKTSFAHTIPFILRPHYYPSVFSAFWLESVRSSPLILHLVMHKSRAVLRSWHKHWRHPCHPCNATPLLAPRNLPLHPTLPITELKSFLFRPHKNPTTLS